MSGKQRSRTRKLKGGMFGVLKQGAQRAAHTASSLAGRIGQAAPTWMGGPKGVFRPPARPMSSSKGASVVNLGTRPSKVPGKRSGYLSASKPINIKLTTEEFPERNVTVNNVRRIHHASYKGIWRKLFPRNGIPPNLTKQQFEDLMIQKLEENGRLFKPKANATASSATKIQEADNFIAASLLTNEANPQEAQLLAEAGDDYLQMNPPLGEVKGAVSNYAREIRSKSAENVHGIQNTKEPVLVQTLNAQRERILLETTPNMERLKELQLSEILYWQPLRTLVYKLGFPLVNRLPLVSRMTRSVMFPGQMMLSGRNLSKMRSSSMLPFEPSHGGWETINTDIATIVRYKLSYSSNFDFKAFKTIFDPDSLVRLKFGIVKYYLLDKEGGKQLLSDFFDTVNYGLINEPSIFNDFLKKLERDPIQAHEYLNSLLSTEAAQRIKQKYVTREAYLKSKGWFAGRTMWSVLLGSGIAGCLLLLGWFGVKSGFPILDNLAFRLFVIGESSPSSLSEVAATIKEKLQTLGSEASIYGRVIEGELLTPAIENAKERGKPISNLVQKALEQHEQITGPYRNTTFSELFTGRKYPKPLRNRTLKLPKINEANESVINNNS
jgi:hypothetical protein